MSIDGADELFVYCDDPQAQIIGRNNGRVVSYGGKTWQLHYNHSNQFDKGNKHQVKLYAVQQTAAEHADNECHEIIELLQPNIP